MAAKSSELTPRSRTSDPERQIPAAGDTEASSGGDGATRRGAGPGAAAGGATPPGMEKTSVATLVKDLAADLQTLVKQEIELAKMEATQTVKRVVVDSAWIGAGVAIIAVAGLCLVFALALGLGALLDSYWLGTLITGGILFLLGALFAWKGLRDLKKGGFTPDETLGSLQEDKSWAEREADDFKTAIGKG